MFIDKITDEGKFDEIKALFAGYGKDWDEEIRKDYYYDRVVDVLDSISSDKVTDLCDDLKEKTLHSYEYDKVFDECREIVEYVYFSVFRSLHDEAGIDIAGLLHENGVTIDDHYEYMTPEDDDEGWGYGNGGSGHAEMERDIDDLFS